MNCILRFIIILCCLTLYRHSASGQVEGSIVEASLLNKDIPFTITSYSTRNGLPQNQVTHILRRRDGGLIVHTSNGIVDFNGYRFKPVSTDKNYKKQIFKSLHYFGKSNILLGQDWNDGLYRLSPEYQPFSIHNTRPMACLTSGDSLLVIAASGDVYLCDPETGFSSMLFKNHGHPFDPLEEFMTRAVQKGKQIYVTDKSGLFCIDLERQSLSRIAESDCHDLILNPYNGQVYAILQQSIVLIRNNQLVQTGSINTAFSHGRTTDAFFSDSTSLYLATNNGLIHIGPTGTAHYTKADGLPSSGIQTLLYDPLNNCIFAGTTERGFLKLQFKNNYPIQIPDNHYQKSVSSVVRTSQNQVFTVAGPYFYRIDAGGAQEIFMRKAGEHASLAEIDGLLYLGTWGKGVLIYKDYKPFDTLLETLELPNNRVHACFKDSKGRIWVGTDFGIARGNSRQTVRPLLRRHILESAFCFYELRNGNVCIGTSDGGYIVHNDSVVASFHAADGFKGKEVRSFYEDKEGRIWIGSYGGGLYCYDKGILTSINAMKNCMLYEDAFCIAKDRYGYLYMTSNRGLWRVSEKDLAAFYEKKIGYLVPFHYTEESGFQNTEFNGGFQNNFLKDGNSFLFPTIEGLVRTVPEKPVYTPVFPGISSIRVNDTLAADAHVFDRSTYSLQFEFECLNLVAKHNVYFQHKLVGETNYEWSVPQKQTSVYLKMLPPGKYTFLVRAIDAFNDRKPRAVSYSFEILPYFYETLWFRVLAIILLVFLMVGVAMLRIAGNRKKIEQKEYYRRKISEVELNAIQAQLNPHFIFNCMNTIKYFILEKNFSNANEGLNRLSKLIRNSMENSEKLFTSLRQEITFMTNYIELEKMRLREQLEYTIQVAPGVALSTPIPHLFIQPHIENAIKHGISNLENKQGILRIEIAQNDNYIICTVEDNGIGREAAGKLMNDSPHVSKGTRLTTEKSQLLKQYYQYDCSITITDLYTDTGESDGTRVSISMSRKYKPENLVSLS